MTSRTDINAVFALIENYWFRARKTHNMMFDAKARYDASSTEDERDTIFRNDLSPSIDLFIASLFPVCDGFRKIGLKNAHIDKLIGELMSILRGASKAVGSYTDDKDYKHQTGRLLTTAPGPDMNTAEDLFNAFEQYFASHVKAHAPPDEGSKPN